MRLEMQQPKLLVDLLAQTREGFTKGKSTGWAIANQTIVINVTEVEYVIPENALITPDFTT